MLGSDIGRLVRRRHQSMGRCQVNDPAKAPGPHARQGSLDGVKRGTQIDGHHGIPPVSGKGLQRRHMLDASIVYQYINAPEGLLRVGDELGDFKWL